MENFEESHCEMPYDSILDEETTYFTYCFCSICSLMLNQKLNLQKILILMMKNEKIMDLFKEIINEMDSKEAVRLFLSVNPTAFSEKTVIKNIFGDFCS